MSVLMADTTLIDRVFEEALRALDHLSDDAGLLDLGYDPLEETVDDRRPAAATGPSILSWPLHLIGAH